MIIITGTVLAQRETFDEILRMSTEHVLRSRVEPGCISHAVFRDTEETLRLHFLERWADMEALQVHFVVPESRTFAGDLARLAAEPPTMSLYNASEVRRG